MADAAEVKAARAKMAEKENNYVQQQVAKGREHREQMTRAQGQGQGQEASAEDRQAKQAAAVQRVENTSRKAETQGLSP